MFPILPVPISIFIVTPHYKTLSIIALLCFVRKSAIRLHFTNHTSKTVEKKRWVFENILASAHIA